MSSCYVYYLRDPRDNAIRYVGITNNPNQRLFNHLYRSGHRTHKERWVDQLMRLNLAPEMEVVMCCDSVQKARYAEDRLITELRKTGVALTNCPEKMTPGRREVRDMLTRILKRDSPSASLREP